MSRGRPSEKPAIVLDKWVQDNENQIWYFDRSKSSNGCYKVENKFIAGEKQAKPIIDQRMYSKDMPTVIVFKTSNRSNAKTKMKIINKNIDYVLSAKKIPGIPDIAEWLEVGIGKSFVSKYKQKYSLA
tara:strand:+ start:461 stop:844 length:384 start_codon:yes stop_codon:yes gene_type:complete